MFPPLELAPAEIVLVPGSQQSQSVFSLFTTASGASIQLVTSGWPSGDGVVLNFFVENGDFATVNSTGLVTALGAGSTIVVARAEAWL